MKILLISLCVIIAFVTGSIGFMGHFSNGLEKSLNERLLVIFPLYIISSLIIGALAGRAWKISVLNNWASFFMSGALFLARMVEGDINDAIFGFTGFVILPLISLLFGYLGSRVGSKLAFYLKTKRLSTK